MFRLELIHLHGEAKAVAVAGALRGGFINTLIIDSACGEKLL
ncbi:hypothetical protein DWX83_06580 [Ruminococcus sp. AF21-42]|nr:hypothetical protein DWX83_06580 [Ruminococcus sp. AF21-42]